jgi:7-keto-8-aminopelargonate synthetase-like enzyme
MDGDFTLLKDFVQLCHKYSAVNMIDKAHSRDIFGKECKGLDKIVRRFKTNRY